MKFHNFNLNSELARAALLFLVCALLAAPSLHACSVPVFRYALDRWTPDLFRLEVPASLMNQPGAVDLLRPVAQGSGANVELAFLDGATEARLLRPGAGESVLWTGKLDSASTTLIADSPARAEIARRILAGHSMVWVLVESSDSAANEEAAATLQKRLAFLTNVAELPVMDPTDPSNKLGPGPELRIEFSVLRVRADDPAEQLFLKTLAGPKADAELTKGSWFSTVFGRGRALGAWPAKGFGSEQIDEVCLFLLGACSCQVKNLNPGWDLLLKIDWDTELINAQKLRLAHGTPEAPAPSDSADPAPETVSITGAGPAKPGSDSSSSPPKAYLAGAIILLAIGSFMFWRGRANKS